MNPPPPSVFSNTTTAYRITLLHLSTLEEKSVEVVNFYPPAWLTFKWGNFVGMFTANLRLDGRIQGLTTWRIQDMREAWRIYNALSLARHPLPSDRPIRPDDLAALAHWKKKGLL